MGSRMTFQGLPGKVVYFDEKTMLGKGAGLWNSKWWKLQLFTAPDCYLTKDVGLSTSKVNHYQKSTL